MGKKIVNERVESTDDKVWVLVEAVSQFRIRYMVEVHHRHPEYALDDVTMGDCEEFSQHHLGEVIVSHRVVTEQEALQLCDEDNTYARSWSDEHKKQVFFTKERN
jgi:hypothetical protein